MQTKSKIKNFIKAELKGWSKNEIIWLSFCSISILALSLYWRDSLMSILASLTGIWCVILTGKCKRSSFIFGIINVICYSYISFFAKFYGEVMLNMLYFLPMNIIGWIVWSKNMDTDKGEAIKGTSSFKSKILIYSLTFIAILIYGYILKHMGGNLPYIDSMSTVISVTAMILSVKRMPEQWTLWTVVNSVTVVMWLSNFIKTGEGAATIAMWTIYLVNGLIIYFKWKREEN